MVRALLNKGAGVVAAARKASEVVERFGDSVTAARLDFNDRASWLTALQGADRVFLMRPPAISNVRENINPFIDFARAHRVGHIAFLSVAGAGSNRIVPHRKVEDHLRAASTHYTNLRPGFFAQNLESAYRRDLVEDNRIYVPAGHRPVNWIDVRDIAEVAALVLTQPAAHQGQSYTLTGPRPVPWSELTQALSAALGRPIRYEAASLLGYVRHLSRQGLAPGAIAVQTVLHFLLRFGQGATVDPTLEHILGRPGRGVQEYIADHVETWTIPSSA